MGLFDKVNQVSRSVSESSKSAAETSNLKKKCLLCLLLITTREITMMAAANRSCMPMEIHELLLNEPL